MRASEVVSSFLLGVLLSSAAWVAGLMLWRTM